MERARLVIRIGQRHVDNLLELFTQHIDRHRQTGRFRRQQVLIRRFGLFAFCRRKAAAFDEVDHRGRNGAELGTGFARGGDILAAQRRIFQQLLAGIAAHERHIQPPAGQSDKRHIQQVLFQEKLRHRQTVTENITDQHDIRPALMITDHHMPAVTVQVGGIMYFPLHPVHQPQHQRIAAQPAIHHIVTAAGQHMPDHRNRHQQFQQGHNANQQRNQRSIQDHHGNTEHHQNKSGKERQHNE